MQSRIQVVDEMALFPMRCFFTHNAKVSPVIDTGFDAEDWGRVYIGLDYFTDLAEATGWVPKKQLEDAILAQVIEGDELMAAQNELERLRGSVDVTKIVKEITDGVLAAVRAELGVLRVPAPAVVDVPEVGSGSAVDAPDSGHVPDRVEPPVDRPTGFPRPGGVRPVPLGQRVDIDTPEI